PAALVLGAAALVLALESGVLVGVLLPGSTTLVVLGLWSATAGAHPALPIAVAAAASTGGALHGWLRGHRHPGTGLPLGRLRPRAEPAVRQAQAWLTARPPGQTALVLAAAHWAAVTRTLTPRVAGGADVPLRLVAPVVTASCAAWATTVVLLSRQFGQQVADDAGWVPVAALAVLAGAVLVRRRLRHRSLPPP
ncbi:DedA family protein, partial [Modestobacter roseus]